MVFITAGMGGGTGTGAAPIFAEIAKELGILTVAVVSKPFEFEGPKRMKLAETGVTQLEDTVHSLIVILNNKLEEVMAVSDEVSIMRDGRMIGTWPTGSLTVDAVVSRMVGLTMMRHR